MWYKFLYEVFIVTNLPTQNEKFIQQEINDLHKEVTNLTQEVNVLEKRFDFMQDADARIMLEQQAIIKSMKLFTKIANDLMDKEEEKTTKKPTGAHYG